MTFQEILADIEKKIGVKAIRGVNLGSYLRGLYAKNDFILDEYHLDFKRCSFVPKAVFIDRRKIEKVYAPRCPTTYVTMIMPVVALPLSPAKENLHSITHADFDNGDNFEYNPIGYTKNGWKFIFDDNVVQIPEDGSLIVNKSTRI